MRDVLAASTGQRVGGCSVKAGRPQLMCPLASFACWWAAHIDNVVGSCILTPTLLSPPHRNDAYRLSSFAMSLLLSLRLGRAYERWWSARWVL